jgi:hypothetical protein
MPPTATVKDTETETMFPELDTTKPEQKALLSAAKKLAKLRGERDQLLTTSKEKVDTQMQKVITLMHENKVTKFRHQGVTAEIIQTREKVEVEIEEDEDGDGSSDE